MLEDARLDYARMKIANLSKARSDGANLSFAVLDEDSDLTVESSLGSALRETDYSDCLVSSKLFQEAFGDASVKLPMDLKAGEEPLLHWSVQELDDNEFDDAWQVWQSRTYVREWM